MCLKKLYLSRRGVYGILDRQFAALCMGLASFDIDVRNRARHFKSNSSSIDLYFGHFVHLPTNVYPSCRKLISTTTTTASLRHWSPV